VTESVAGISPEPTDEEAAAIIAAASVVFAAGAAAADGPEPSRWRWSGRWWSRPVPQTRSRP
jgi:hypothetical protein